MFPRLFTATLLLAASTMAATITYTANLSGANESPSNSSFGIGTATATYDDVARSLAISATFSGLSGTTTAAHIHCCTAVASSGNAGVATTTPTFVGFPLSVTAGTFSNTLDLALASSYNPAFITANGGTTAGAELALAAGLAAGKAYFNIHSSTFGSGEIRGFFTASAVPEPTTLGLSAAALLFILHRRRK